MNVYADIQLNDEEKTAWEEICKARSAIITSHIHPDGDAVGSSLALFRYCKEKGVSARVIIDDNIPDIYGFLPDIEIVEQPSEHLEADLLIVLDTDMRRTGRVSRAKVKKTVNIDHHGTNSLDCDYNIIRGEQTSTAELLYRLFNFDSFDIDKQMAECLYTGLVTDTVFFKVPMHSPDVFFIAGELAKAGADHARIAEVVSTKKLKDLRLSAMAYERLECIRNNTVIGMTLDETFDELELTDELVDSIRYTEGIEIAFLLKHEKEGGYRVRMRSQTKDVSVFAKQHHGGGHPDAAGYTIDLDNAETARDVFVKEITKWLE